MPQVGKKIKGRIKSVNNIRKITKAMEMVAASKMRKSINQALGTREYAALALELLAKVSQDQKSKHQLLRPGKSDRKLIVAIGADRGMAGAYNVNLVKAVNNFIKTKNSSDFDLITIGKNAERQLKNLGANLLASFLHLPDNPTLDDVASINALVLKEFQAGAYEQVLMVYTDFISVVKNQVVWRTILPISENNLQKITASLMPENKRDDSDVVFKKDEVDYIYEPNIFQVLEIMLPTLSKMQIYQGLLESMASEHSSRMVAMRNASDSATTIGQELTLLYNNARQASITQEIAEIAAAAG